MDTHDRLHVGSQHLAQGTRTLEQDVIASVSVVERINADGGLTDKQKEFKIKAEREKVMPLVLAKRKMIEEGAAQIESQRAYWESAPFLLSQQRFTEPASSDAVIKRWHADRLARLPIASLALEFAHARHAGDFAMLGLVLAERAGRKVEPSDELADSTRAFSLDGIELPGQRVALAAIASAKSDLAYSEHLFKMASGTPITQVEKLTRARLTQERTPTAREAPAASTVRDDLIPPLPSRIPVTDMPAAA